MPSELVHLAIGALVGAAVLPRFDRRALAVVLVAAMIPDVDTFLGLWIRSGHRTLLHTLAFPGALAGTLLADDRLREVGRLRARVGDRGVRLAWAGLASLTFGGIAPDLFTNGVNALYPFVDTFYAVNGRFVLSDQRGVVQTFVEVNQGGGSESVSTTENTHYRTGVDPSPGESEGSPERVFPVVRRGWQVLVILASSVAVAARLSLERRR
ncbi:MAG: metal-dependent hydrolase [Halolamina sp.]